ncbi:MAG: MFS transporter [Agarilytica sp.]
MLIRNKYTIETIAFISYVLFAMAWVGGTANMAQIMEAMNVESLAKASLLSGTVTLAKIVGTFIAAGIAVKLGVKYAFFAAALMIAVGLATPYSPNYDILLASRFVMGLGGALMIVYLNPIVLKYFEPSERPIVNGINAVAFNVGTAIVLWFVSDINALLGGWKNALAAFSIASIVLAVLWLLVDYSEAEKSEGAAGGEAPKQAHYGYIEGLKDSFNWRFSLAYAGILAFYICLFTFSSSAGITQTKYVMGFGILGTLAGMIYSQRFPKRLPILRWSGFGVVVSAAGLFFFENVMLKNACGMATGFFIFLPVSALVTLPQELPGMTGQRITVVFSLFYSISYMFSTLCLWIFGQLVDMNNGQFESAFMFIIFISSTFFFGSFFLPETAAESEPKEAEAPVAEPEEAS